MSSLSAVYDESVRAVCYGLVRAVYDESVEVLSKDAYIYIQISVFYAII